MNEKIVSIVMTAFMLIMCIGLITVFQFTNNQKNQDIMLARTDQSVLSTDGEVKSDSGVSMTGESVISSVKYKDSIDSQRQIVGKDTIYGGYKIYFGSNPLTTDNVESFIDTGVNYVLIYDMDAHRITVKRS